MVSMVKGSALHWNNVGNSWHRRYAVPQEQVRCYHRIRLHLEYNCVQADLVVWYYKPLLVRTACWELYEKSKESRMANKA